MSDTVLVSLDGAGGTQRVGTAFTSRRRNVTVSTFRYEQAWVSSPAGYAIDPTLPLDVGSHHTQGLPGAFADCAPDRWGRNLIDKRARVGALARGEIAPRLGPVDYLLGVTDETRQGALRFQVSEGGPYEATDPGGVPQLIELPALMRAADSVVRGDDDLAAVKALLDAGTGSLGGARPKASVRDGDRLMIAKFPHAGDGWDVMAWEKTVLDLARDAGIDVPVSELATVDGHGVLLLDRFDRDAEGRRVAYQSAMTMVEATDGDQRDYVDVAQALSEHGSRVRGDLHQLWRRLVFGVAVHNTDDHLRNLGFLRHGRGWALAPMFDVNPDPDVGAARSTGIAGAEVRDQEVEGLHACMAELDVDQARASVIVGEVLAATAGWRERAGSHGIPDRQVRDFEPVFDGMRGPLELLLARRPG